MKIFVVLVFCATVYGEFVKMGRMNSRTSFIRGSKTGSDTNHELIFAVQQRNLDKLDGILMERSTPGSSKYQQWLSFKEVGDLTSNPDGAIALKNWLLSNGITASWESVHHDYIKATASVQLWEQLLDTSFYNWQDTALKGSDAETKVFIRATEYSIPAALQGHVSAVFNTVQVPPVIHKDYHLRPNNKVKKSNLRLNDVLANNPSLLSEATAPDVTISFLNSYYGITSNIGTSLLNQSVFETSSEYFSQSDLLIFQQTYGTTQQAAIDVGGYQTTNCGVIDNCDEGNLDIQYIMGISQVTSSIYWYVPGDDAFVNWVTDIANESNPPKTNSMSWGSIEQDQSIETLSAFTTEAQKATLQGVTIMVSSGDDGVANYGCPCSSNSKDPISYFNCACQANSGSSISHWSGSNSWSGEGYFPSFPASCPYVTAVGATMFPLNAQGTKNDKPEIAAMAQYGGIVTSGGGFSTYYAQPSWQTNAVNTYFNSLTSQPASGYNSQGRGIPDVAVLGVNYQVIIHGEPISIYGTSCASPMFAGMISLLNAKRYLAGMSTLGFINPTIYSAAVPDSEGNYYNHYFNDVIVGDNACCSNSDWPTAATICCAAGFNTSKGWDPVSGWGSVQFANLTTLFPTLSTYPTIFPSARPTPLPGAPTFVPTVSNVVSTSISQQVLGNGVNATSFDSSLANLDSFVQAVEESITNTANVVINSLVNVYSTSSSAKSDSKFHAEAASSVIGVLVGYTVSVNNGAGMSSQASYDSINTEITNSVNSNNFTLFMQSAAVANNAPLLTTATSKEVTVADTFNAPTFAPTSSPGSGNSDSSVIIVAVVVPLLVIAFVAGVAWFFWRKPKNQTANQDRPVAATTTPPMATATAIPAVHVVNPIGKASATSVHNNM